MPKRFFSLFHKEFNKLHDAAYLLGAFSLLSQVLGLFRDRLLAHSFGASHALDTYYAAFRIPDLLYVSVASFASAAVLIPFFVERKEESTARAKKFINDIFTLFFASMAAVSIIVFFLMPVLAPYVVPGFSPADRAEFILLSRVLLLSPFLLGLSNLLGTVTQSANKFFVFAFSPVLYNAGIIVGIILFAPIFGIGGVVLGVVLGAFLHLAIQIPTVFKEGYFPNFSHNIDWRSAKSAAILSLPRTIALSAGNIAVLALITFASYISEGSISIFQLSLNLQSVPLSIVGVSYSVAAFPSLSRLFAKGEREAFVSEVMNAAKHIVFWSLPVVFLFIVLRAQIVRVILGSGQFNWEDTRLTAASLALFTVSLVAQSLILLFTRAYYAAGLTRKPVAINVLSAVFIVASGWFFMGAYEGSGAFKSFFEETLRVRGIEGSDVIMLPLAFTLGMWLNALLLGMRFSRDFGGFTKEVVRAFWQSFAASFVIGTVAFYGLQVLAPVFHTETFLGVLFHGAIAGMMGILAGVAVLSLLGNPEYLTVKAALHRKFWKSHPVIPEM